MINRKNAPHIVDAIDLNLRLKPYEKYILKNGVEVYAINAGAEEVMMIDWVFYAGNWYEDQNLQAATVNYLLKNGTSRKTAFEINEHFEYYGAYLNRNCIGGTVMLKEKILYIFEPGILNVREFFADGHPAIRMYGVS